MAGICFKENMFKQIVSGHKTQTRRLIKNDAKPRFKIGRTVKLKEPYQFNYHLVQKDLLYEPTQEDIVYKYLSNTSYCEMLEEKWKNKLFMPDKFARYQIKINNIRKEFLRQITEKDAIAEGIEDSRPIALGYKNYMNPANYFNKKKMYEFEGKKYSGAAMSFFSLCESIDKTKKPFSECQVYVYDFEIIPF